MNIIYHSRDLDGFSSGAIVKKRYPEGKLIPFDYAWDFEKLLAEVPKGEPVVMIDVSLPMEQMVNLADHAGEFIWIDHHKSAIDDFKNYDWPPEVPEIVDVLKVGIAACEIGWNWFFPNSEMPRAIKLLGEYDTWRNKDKERWDNLIIPFQFGMRLDVSSADTFPQELLDDSIGGELRKHYLEVGKTIVAYQTQQNTIACRAAFEIDFMGHVAICLNAGGLNSQAFDSVYDSEKHDIMIPFRFNGKVWNFSMYTTKDEVDVSEIAKQLGGGGHKAAAGFHLTTEQIVNSYPEFIGGGRVDWN